jgi:YD repeat-containing protein
MGPSRSSSSKRGTDPLLVNRDLGYDPSGNVTSVNDLVHGENVAHGYDDLDRLTSAGAPLNESYGYSAIGDLTSRNGQAYDYADPAHKHAATAYGGWAYGYDANGCLTTRNATQRNQAIKYDPERRPVRVTLAGRADPVARFAYDGSSGRRERLDASGTIHYLGVYERNVGNGAPAQDAATKYYHASLGRPRRPRAAPRGRRAVAGDEVAGPRGATGIGGQRRRPIWHPRPIR